MTGPRRAVALALVVVLSGCTLGVGNSLAPQSAEPTDTQAPRPADGSTTVSLANHSLSSVLDADRTFARIEALTDENVTRPPVQVIERSGGNGDGGSGLTSFRYAPYRFAQYMEFDNFSASEPGAAGLTDGFGNVYIVPSDGGRYQLEKVLAHEFVHVVQIRSGMLRQGESGTGLTPANSTVDAAQVHYALVEGAAVYVTDVYVRRYLPANVTLQSVRIARDYEQSHTGGRYVFARYHFGSQYVSYRLDSPAGLRSLYSDPPQTTEQLLHNGSTGGAVYQPLSVSATGGNGWRLVEPDEVDIMGELFLRIALRQALDRERAVRAATGWGNDRLVEFERGDRAGFAWALRFDDARNATQFREAFRTYRQRRSTPPSLALRATPVGDETVTVLVGPPAFVSNVTVAGSSEDVRVAVGT